MAGMTANLPVKQFYEIIETSQAEYLIVLFSHRHSIFQYIFCHSIFHKSGVKTDVTRFRKSDLCPAIWCS